jgi:hypothetical protein
MAAAIELRPMDDDVGGFRVMTVRNALDDSIGRDLLPGRAPLAE